MQMLNEVDIGLRKTILGTERNNHITKKKRIKLGTEFYNSLSREAELEGRRGSSKTQFSQCYCSCLSTTQ